MEILTINKSLTINPQVINLHIASTCKSWKIKKIASDGLEIVNLIKKYIKFVKSEENFNGREVFFKLKLLICLGELYDELSIKIENKEILIIIPVFEDLLIWGKRFKIPIYNNTRQSIYRLPFASIADTKNRVQMIPNHVWKRIYYILNVYFQVFKKIYERFDNNNDNKIYPSTWD